MTDTLHSLKTDSAPQQAAESPKRPMPESANETRPFGRFNLICMAACLVMIVVGFALMAGPGSTAEGGFNPDIFSTRRIVIGPALAFLGFLFMAFAIIIKPDMLSRLRNHKFCTNTDKDKELSDNGMA